MTTLNRAPINDALRSMGSMFKFHMENAAYYTEIIPDTSSTLHDFYEGMAESHKRAAGAYKASCHFIALAVKHY